MTIQGSHFVDASEVLKRMERGLFSTRPQPPLGGFRLIMIERIMTEGDRKNVRG